MMTRSLTSKKKVATTMKSNGTDRATSGSRRKITQPLTRMLR